jgi:hypothetical protein
MCTTCQLRLWAHGAPQKFHPLERRGSGRKRVRHPGATAARQESYEKVLPLAKLIADQADIYTFLWDFFQMGSEQP